MTTRVAPPNTTVPFTGGAAASAASCFCRRAAACFKPATRITRRPPAEGTVNGSETSVSPSTVTSARPSTPDDQVGKLGASLLVGRIGAARAASGHADGLPGDVVADRLAHHANGDRARRQLGRGNRLAVDQRWVRHVDLCARDAWRAQDKAQSPRPKAQGPTTEDRRPQTEDLSFRRLQVRPATLAEERVGFVRRAARAAEPGRRDRVFGRRPDVVGVRRGPARVWRGPFRASAAPTRASRPPSPCDWRALSRSCRDTLRRRRADGSGPRRGREAAPPSRRSPSRTPCPSRDRTPAP